MAAVRAEAWVDLGPRLIAGWVYGWRELGFMAEAEVWAGWVVIRVGAGVAAGAWAEDGAGFDMGTVAGVGPAS